MEDKRHKNANGARLNHGETVLQVQAALGMTDAGWLSPDVVVNAVKRLWASTIPSLDRDHPSYEMRPVYFAPKRSTSVLNDETKGGEA
jgi:hypothetical protein